MTAQDLKAAHILVTGDVQGVSFRRFMQSAADELRVSGWVRNRADGSVEAWLEGDESAVQAMLERIKKGSQWARIYNVDIKWEKPQGFRSFELRPTE